MDKYRNSRLKELVDFIKNQGLIVNMNTKARGHLGFFTNGRIDISKNTPEERIIPTLLHEYSHYIHSQMEENIAKTGGSLKVLFKTENIEEIFNELVEVTHFIDENSLHKKLSYHQELIKTKSGLSDNTCLQSLTKSYKLFSIFHISPLGPLP